MPPPRRAGAHSTLAREIPGDPGDPGGPGGAGGGGSGGAPPRPRITAVCDTSADARQWFERNVPDLALSSDDYTALLKSDAVDALYIAVPHNLHERLYIDAIEAGKHVLGEKPFGIDAPANARITAAIAQRPDLCVRCSSEMPFFPGAQAVVDMVRRGDLGRIIEVESGFWHSSDLNPDKPINWKRRRETCGDYGCLGDLGMHTLHLPLRFGWRPESVRCVLSDLVHERPDGRGGQAVCDTPENGTIFCRVRDEGVDSRDTGVSKDSGGETSGGGGRDFPMTISTKRVAPGHNNTWFIRIVGTRNSAAFSTANPKVLRTLPYDSPGQAQAWHVRDVPFASCYPTVTGAIFEFGFPDAILQMWAAFCDELAGGKAGPFGCVTPAEAEDHHAILTAALHSHERDAVVRPEYRA